MGAERAAVSPARRGWEKNLITLVCEKARVKYKLNISSLGNYISKLNGFTE